MSNARMTETQRGILAAIAANAIWGTSPIFWKALAHVPPMEVFAHRTFWGAVIFGVIVLWRGRLNELMNLLSDRSTRLAIIGATMMVSVNWSLYIWSVQANRMVEASIGYYIFPLVAVALGIVFLGERLSSAKVMAILLAVIAVLYLTWSLHVVPWISITLAVTFGLYGLIKKGIPAGPTITVTAEVMLIAPLSLIWLSGIHLAGWTDFTGRAGGYFFQDPVTGLLLVASGAVTAVPLMLFSSASRKVSYGTVGILQYLNPTLQFCIATLLFAEPLTRGHVIALPLIWIALIIYTASSVRGGARAAAP